jgi:hypothetical protein
MQKIAMALLLIASGVCAQTAADTSAWKNSLAAGLTATQVSYTDWVQGGENALSWSATIDGKHVYDRGISIWTTTYGFAYGTTKLGTQGIRKTDDKIVVATEYKYKMSTYVDPYLSANLKTQFARGYTYDALGNGTAVSDFFDPAFMIQSAGFGYQPTPQVKTRLGAALREVITSTYTNYADDPKTTAVEKTKVEGGVESVTEVEASLDDNLLLRAKLELFSPLKTPEEIIVYSDITLAAKVSKYISANLNVQIVHEKPISPRTQVKQTLALGLSYVIF